MAEHLGRELTLEWGGSEINGVREKNFTLNNEVVDVTSDENSGWRKLLSTPGQKQVDLTVSGIAKDSVLEQDYFDGNLIRQLTIEDPDNNIILDGEFFLVSFQKTGPYNDATTFEATFQSTGAVQRVDYA